MSGSPVGEERGAIQVFVEDPGAANYVAALPQIAAKEGWRVRLLAHGAALDYLLSRGVHAEAFPAGKAPAEVLRRDAPSLLIVGTSENGRTPAHELVHAARAAGLPTLGVVDAFANAAHRFRGDAQQALAHVPDCIAVPDEWTRRAYLDLGMAPSCVVVCGHPQYDAVREEAARLRAVDRDRLRRELFPGAAPEQPIVVFVAEVSTGLDPGQYRLSPEYTLRGTGGAEGRTEIVLEELLDGLKWLGAGEFLVLRPHPKNRLSEFEAYLPAIDAISSGGSPLEVVFAADLVVGMTTMLLLEAAILGSRTLSIVPRPLERQWLPTLRAGVTPCATTREEVRGHLQRLLRSSAGDPDPLGEDVVLFGSAERLRRLIAERLGAPGSRP